MCQCPRAEVERILAHCQRAEIPYEVVEQTPWALAVTVFGPVQIPVCYVSYMCMDCGQDRPQIYMVTDEVWLSVVPGDEGILCLECLERRLQRNLCLEDFLSAVPCNAFVFAGARMVQDGLNGCRKPHDPCSQTTTVW